MRLKDYMQDGACEQARATLPLIKHTFIGTDRDYQLKVGRWENCREQGYVVSLFIFAEGEGHQLNVAFFEHRNSDELCAVQWEQVTINSPTVDNMTHEKYKKSKWALDHSLPYGSVYEMAQWITKQFEVFFTTHHKV